MKISTFTNDYPNLMSEWDWDKNSKLGLDPTTKIKSNVSIGWKCIKNHSWEDTLAHRLAGRNCPYCSNHRLLTGYNDLATQNPVLANEWHPSLNGDLSPKDVFACANKMVWWLCKSGHSWTDTVNHRSAGRNCPYCSGRKLLSGYNDLETINPDLASEWHPTLNGNTTPKNVFPNSSKKAWWRCALGHEWEAVISSRNRGNGCPVCSKEQKTSFPEQAVYFYIKKLYKDSINRYIDKENELDIYIPSINIGIEYDGMRYHNRVNEYKEKKKEDYFANKGICLIRIKEETNIGNTVRLENNIIYYPPIKRYQFLPEAIIELITLIEQKTERNTKSIQIDLEKDSVLIYHSYLSMLKEKSIASSDSLINEWNYSKNNKLNPQYIPINSGKKVWWRCSLGHEWQAVVASRNRGSGCPFCSHNRVLSGYNDLATLKPDLASEWHPTKNGDLLPDNILSSTAKKVWWRCHLGHDWQASPNDRARGNGCPYCSNQRVAVGENDLCTENPYLAAEWHPTKNGNLVPSMFVSGSSEKVWWMCKEGHEWQANIYHRNNGSGCPICHFKKLSKHNSKGINVYNASDLSFYGTFDCARTLCEHFGIEYSKQMGNIASICRRQQKTLMRKYILRYVDDDELRKE